jgi:hypothetical protein
MRAIAAESAFPSMTMPVRFFLRFQTLNAIFSGRTAPDGGLRRASAPWPATAVGPSTQGFQHAYVNARANEINRLGDKTRAAAITLFRADPILGSRLKGYSGSKTDAFCANAYDRLIKDLQSRELTINFEADNWFADENTYTSYTRMYERAIGKADNRMLLMEAHIFQCSLDFQRSSDAFRRGVDSGNGDNGVSASMPNLQG